MEVHYGQLVFSSQLAWRKFEVRHIMIRYFLKTGTRTRVTTHSQGQNQNDLEKGACPFFVIQYRTTQSTPV
jgi:hypothetical protein